MAFSRDINLNVNASGVQAGTTQAKSAIQQLIASINSLNSTLNSSGSSLNNFSKSAQRAGQQGANAFDTLHTSATKFKALMASIGVVFTAKTLIDTIDSYTLMNARLKLVTKSQAEFNVAQKDVFSISQDTRSSLTDTVQLYTRIARALDGTGTSLGEVGTITKAVSQGLVISGATAGEAAAGMLQLSQAFNKGKLDGDEFRTVMELMPPVAKAIAKEMGVTRGALLELAPQGKITAEIMKKAMLSASEEIQADFNKFPVTIGQALQTLGNQFVKVGGEGASAFGVGSGIVSAITLMRDNLEDLLSGAVLLATFFAGRWVASMVAAGTASLTASGAIGTLSTALQLLAIRGGAALVLESALGGLAAALNPIVLLGVAAAGAFMLFSQSQKEAADAVRKQAKELEIFETVTRKGLAATEQEIEQLKAVANFRIANAEATLLAAQTQLELAKSVNESTSAWDAYLDVSGLVLKNNAQIAQKTITESKKKIEDLNKALRSLTDQLDAKHNNAVEESSKKYDKLIKKLREAAQVAGLNKTQQAVLNNIYRADIDTTNLRVDAYGNLINASKALSEADAKRAERIAALTREQVDAERGKSQRDAIRDLQQEGQAIGYNSTQMAVLNALKGKVAEGTRIEVDESGKLVGVYEAGAIALAKQAVAANKLKETSTKALEVSAEETAIRIRNISASDTQVALALEEARLRREIKGITDSEVASKLQSLNVDLQRKSVLDEMQRTKNTRADIQDLETQIKMLGSSKEELAVELEKNRLTREGKDLNSTEAQDTLDAVSARAKLTEQYQRQSELANEIDGAFGSALSAAIKGTKSLGAAFKDLAIDIAAAIVKATILASIQRSIGGGSIGGTIAKGLGSILAYADGGSPPVGVASLVGEEGPELFVPNSAGTIISNDKLSSLGGGTSVSVSNPVQVNIINQGTAQEQKSTQESTGPDGQKIITVIVDDIVNKGISSGKYDSSMRNSYGIRRSGS